MKRHSKAGVGLSRVLILDAEGQLAVMFGFLRKIDCSVEDAQEELSDVIEFVYDHIPVSGSDEEPMRKLLAQFAAINYTSLLAGKFEELLSQGGEFALRKVRRMRGKRAQATTTGSVGSIRGSNIRNFFR